MFPLSLTYAVIKSLVSSSNVLSLALFKTPFEMCEFTFYVSGSRLYFFCVIVQRSVKPSHFCFFGAASDVRLASSKIYIEIRCNDPNVNVFKPIRF